MQHIIDEYNNKSNQLSKFRTKYWIEINDQSRGVYNATSDIRFQSTILRCSLCDYSDKYILVKERITTTGEGNDAAARQAHERNKGLIFKNLDPFINCKSEINNAETDNAKDIDIVMPMYNLIEYNDNYSKTSASLWQYFKDQPNDNLADAESFKSKVKITGNTPVDGNGKDVEIIVPLKYSSNFWITRQMLLINCEVSLSLTWSSTHVITNSKSAGRFGISE